MIHRRRRRRESWSVLDWWCFIYHLWALTFTAWPIYAIKGRMMSLLILVNLAALFLAPESFLFSSDIDTLQPNGEDEQTRSSSTAVYISPLSSHYSPLESFRKTDITWLNERRNKLFQTLSAWPSEALYKIYKRIFNNRFYLNRTSFAKPYILSII